MAFASSTDVGEWFATGGEDNNVDIRELGSGNTINTLSGHSGTVYAMAVLPGNKLAAGDGNGQITIWDVGTGSKHSTIAVDSSKSVRALHYDGESGNLLVGCGNDGSEWNLDTATRVATYSGHTSKVNCITVLPSGEVLTGSDDDTMKTWARGSHECTKTISEHGYDIQGFCLFPDGQRLASVARDDTAKVWNMDDMRVTHTVTDHSNSVYGVAVVEGKYVVSGSADSKVVVFDADAGSTKHKITEGSGTVRGIAWLGGNRVAIARGGDKQVQIMDVEAGTVLKQFSAHGSSAHCVVFSDGTAFGPSATAEYLAAVKVLAEGAAALPAPVLASALEVSPEGTTKEQVELICRADPAEISGKWSALAPVEGLETLATGLLAKVWHVGAKKVQAVLAMPDSLEEAEGEGLDFPDVASLHLSGPIHPPLAAWLDAHVSVEDWPPAAQAAWAGAQGSVVAEEGSSVPTFTLNPDQVADTSGAPAGAAGGSGGSGGSVADRYTAQARLVWALAQAAPVVSQSFMTPTIRDEGEGALVDTMRAVLEVVHKHAVEKDLSDGTTLQSVVSGADFPMPISK